MSDSNPPVESNRSRKRKNDSSSDAPSSSSRLSPNPIPPPPVPQQPAPRYPNPSASTSNQQSPTLRFQPEGDVELSRVLHGNPPSDDGPTEEALKKWYETCDDPENFATQQSSAEGQIVQSNFQHGNPPSDDGPTEEALKKWYETCDDPANFATQQSSAEGQIVQSNFQQNLAPSGYQYHPSASIPIHGGVVGPTGSHVESGSMGHPTGRNQPTFPQDISKELTRATVTSTIPTCSVLELKNQPVYRVHFNGNPETQPRTVQDLNRIFEKLNSSRDNVEISTFLVARKTKKFIEENPRSKRLLDGVIGQYSSATISALNNPMSYDLMPVNQKNIFHRLYNFMELLEDEKKIALNSSVTLSKQWEKLNASGDRFLVHSSAGKYSQNAPKIPRRRSNTRQGDTSSAQLDPHSVDDIIEKLKTPIESGRIVPEDVIQKVEKFMNQNGVTIVKMSKLVGKNQDILRHQLTPARRAKANSYEKLQSINVQELYLRLFNWLEHYDDDEKRNAVLDFHEELNARWSELDKKELDEEEERKEKRRTK